MGQAKSSRPSEHLSASCQTYRGPRVYQDYPHWRLLLSWKKRIREIYTETPGAYHVIYSLHILSRDTIDLESSLSVGYFATNDRIFLYRIVKKISMSVAIL